MGKDINISIVLYNPKYLEINNILDIFKKWDNNINNIYLIDNSPIENIQFQRSGVQYFYVGKNIGYGAGHNIAIRESINKGIKYHLVLNPDVKFDVNIMPVLIKKMEEEHNAGMIMPKLLNEDGSVQILSKLLPTPFSLIITGIELLGKLFGLTNKRYTLKEYMNLEMNVPVLSGCFSLFRTSVLDELGLYDESFFMYFEDTDISRRIHSKYKTVYYPVVSIVHGYEKGATKNIKLFKEFVKSGIKYFNKYGWFFDSERYSINKKVLTQLAHSLAFNKI